MEANPRYGEPQAWSRHWAQGMGMALPKEMNASAQILLITCPCAAELVS
jgi:hypothetical protein